MELYAGSFTFLQQHSYYKNGCILLQFSSPGYCTDTVRCHSNYGTLANPRILDTNCSKRNGVKNLKQNQVLCLIQQGLSTKNARPFCGRTAECIVTRYTVPSELDVDDILFYPDSVGLLVDASEYRPVTHGDKIGENIVCANALFSEKIACIEDFFNCIFLLPAYKSSFRKFKTPLFYSVVTVVMQNHHKE